MIGKTGWMFVVILGCLGCQSADGQTTGVVAPKEIPEQVNAEAEQESPAASEKQELDVPQTAGEWLDEIEARTRDIRSLHANVRYVTIQGLLQDEQIRAGDLYYTAPQVDQLEQAGLAKFQNGKTERLAVHFELERIDEHVTPVDRWLVFDGRWLLDIDHQRKQATRRQLAPDLTAGDDESDAVDLPLPIRLERQSVETRYIVSLLEADDSTPDNTVGLHFSPRPEQNAAPFSAWFDRDTLLPVRADTGDPDGDQTRILLFDPQANADVDGISFSTDPPDAPGWDVQIVPLEENAGR